MPEWPQRLKVSNRGRLKKIGKCFPGNVFDQSFDQSFVKPLTRGTLLCNLEAAQAERKGVSQ
jgi:hypothetical protein